jgi:apolipoprotein N-acyltransferase
MVKQILVVLVSGILYFLAWTGHAWPLAWIAPLPVLWSAYSTDKWTRAALVAFLGFVVGGLRLAQIYYGALPASVLVIGTVMLGAAFMLVVLCARFIVRQGNAVASFFAFPLLMVTWEVLTAKFSPDGSFGSLSYSQVSFPPILQVASLLGIAAITFTISLVPNGIAIAALYPTARKKVATVVAGCTIAVLAFGFYAMRDREQPRVTVGLTASDAFPAAFRTEDARLAGEVVAEYSSRIRKLTQRGAEIVVLPEEISALREGWREPLRATLKQAARENHVTVIAGFRRWDEGTIRNVAEVYSPEGELSHTYFKRRLVPGLENMIAPGNSALTIGNGLGIAICKDLDFAGLGREYSSQRTGLMLVPAWDFVKDGWLHASMAIVRGVEGGYSVARSSREGLLTVSDAQGRLIAGPVASSAAEAMVVASVPVGNGRTLYSRVGDVFGWICVAIAVGLVMWALVRSRGRSSIRTAAFSGKN